MKKTIVAGLIILLSYSSYSQNYTFLTYNIRYATVADGVNSWDKRKDFLADQLKFYAPDVFGIQEGLYKQVAYLDSALEDYNYVGVGRDDGKLKGEFSAIFYNSKEFDLLESSTFWLSETPYKVSVGWDAAMERVCTYALFKDVSGRQLFYVFNTHFDHIGENAREKSVELIIEKIEEINIQDYPVIVMGDFNLKPESGPVQRMSAYLNDSKNVSESVSFGPSGTFNGFNFNKPVTERIDYIFTDKQSVSVIKYAVLSDSRNCLYPSDHLPVYVELKFNCSSK
ncbi:MAG: endonuclease/exonuclease/phosphatase family protein [Bacteroidales bacterium]|nr:endonuclease/exonuclease/phosphatase family protein [Bacteroidales bacterium]MCF8391805.1 endonuclease/exonuclease/phosphatase family protein [Bacteroidales bacterium]